MNESEISQILKSVADFKSDFDKFKSDFDTFKEKIWEKFEEFNTRLSIGSNKFTAQRLDIDMAKKDIEELKQINTKQTETINTLNLHLDRLKQTNNLFKIVAVLIGAGLIGLVFELVARWI